MSQLWSRTRPVATAGASGEEGGFESNATSRSAEADCRHMVLWRGVPPVPHSEEGKDPFNGVTHFVYAPPGSPDSLRQIHQSVIVLLGW